MANCYRIEYETKESFYKFHVIAQSMEQATAFLKKNIKTSYKINTMYEVCMVNAVTKEAVSELFIEQEGGKKPIDIKKIWKCPWCPSDFETEQGLKVHIGKMHTK